MRSRRPSTQEATEVARRRLELLSAELAEVRRPANPRAEPVDLGEPLLLDDLGLTHLRPLEAALDTADDRPDPHPSRRPPADAAPGRHARRSVGLGSSVSGWVRDRLPPTLQGHVRLGAGQLSVIAILVAVGLALTAWWVVRGDSTVLIPTSSESRSTGSSPPFPVVDPKGAGEPAQGSVVGGPSGVAGSGASGVAGAGAPSPPGTVVVDVAGKVRHPGIASLPAGSRVVDALAAAGGARRGVDVHLLNLARPLVDGEQILVGVPVPGGVAASAAAAPGAPATVALVNLNSATGEQLEGLPGIGPVTAAAILQWRTENGAFTAVDELLEVSGIGEATLAQIAPFVTL